MRITPVKPISSWRLIWMRLRLWKIAIRMKELHGNPDEGSSLMRRPRFRRFAAVAVVENSPGAVQRHLRVPRDLPQPPATALITRHAHARRVRTPSRHHSRPRSSKLTARKTGHLSLYETRGDSVHSQPTQRLLRRAC